MSSRRAAPLAVLLVVLVAYGAGARHLPELPSHLDVAFYALVVVPAFAAAIWLALPIAGAGTKPLFVLVIAAGAVAINLPKEGTPALSVPAAYLPHTTG